MCTVQVLLYADVTGRTGPSSCALPPRNICRKLFSDDAAPAARSRSEFLRTLEVQLQKEVSERWNFDFRTETPLPGRYQWTRPTAGPRVPPTDSPSTSEVPRAGTSTAPAAPACRTAIKRPLTAANRSPVTAKATQSKITDFLYQRKRHRTTEPELTSPKLKSRRLADSDFQQQSSTTSV